MKKILNKGKVIVSFVSVFAILAVSMLSMFAGVTLFASAEDETTEVTYPISGSYDADFVKNDGDYIYYEDVTDTYIDENGIEQNKIVSDFTAFETGFINNAKGSGTKTDPYIIETANQFAAVVTGQLFVGGQQFPTMYVCFKVADSVKAFNLSNTDSSVDFSKDMTSAQVQAALENATVKAGLEWTTNKSFMGQLDGNGVVVYGLKSDSPRAAGIMPQITGNVVVTNLTVKNSYFRGPSASVFAAYNTKVSPYTSANSTFTLRNCAAYGNVVICNNGGSSIKAAGILIGKTEDSASSAYSYETNAVITDCLVYDNIAKHETRAITYGIVGNLHRSSSAALNGCIIMDSVPHTVYFGANALNNSKYEYVYTNKCNGEKWSNVDGIGGGQTYTYKYTATSAGNVEVWFERVNAQGVNDMGSGGAKSTPFEKTLDGPMFNVDKTLLTTGEALEGIDSAKWTYKAGTYPTPKIYKTKVIENTGAWTGTTAYEFFEGDGTENTPYIITTAEELALMLTTEDTANKYYKLGTNIVINDTTVADWQNSAKKWFTSNDVPDFKGSLDGNGKTVSGIYYDGSQVGEQSGLIPVLNSPGSVKKLTVANSELTAKSGAVGGVIGAVADRAKKAIKLEAISVKDTVKFDGNASKGGIIGYLGRSRVQINDSISESAGILGGTNGVAKVMRCISVNAYPFADITEVSVDAVYTNVDGDRFVSDGVELLKVLTVDQMKGNAAATNMPGLGIPTAWAVVANNYPTPTGVALAVEGVKGEVWSGGVASEYAGGTGTAEDPYQIETAEQLALCITTNNSTKEKPLHYILTADIYLNDVNSSLWEEKIGCNTWYDQYAKYDNFKYTTFDGDGYVVYGLFVDHTGNQEKYTRTGLFPMINIGTTIKNIGMSQAYLVVNPEIKDDDVGTIVGYIPQWNTRWPLEARNAGANQATLNNPEFKAEQPKIINCFVDNTCYLEGQRPGGLVGLTKGPIHIENCTFTGSMKSDPDYYFGGTFVGIDDGYGSTVKDCVSLPQTCDTMMGGASHSSWRTMADYYVTAFEDAYYFAIKYQTGALTTNAIKILKPAQRVGEAAREAMTGLDWVDEYDPNAEDQTTWLVIDNSSGKGTPMPSIFAKHRSIEELTKFSDTNFSPPEVEVSFITGTDEIAVPSIVGRMYAPIQLPVPPARLGYKFTGWYVFDDLSIEYPNDYFPPRSLKLFAGWETNGVIQNFENYADTMWDYDDEYWRLNKPGAKGGYKNAYVRNGAQSMHLLDGNAKPTDMLLNYEDMLEPGKPYTITFWVTTDKADNPATLLTLVHNEKPVYRDTQVAAETMAVVTGLKVGEWVQYSYSFNAQTEWVSIRATGNSSLYFDDIVMAKLDGTLSGGNYIGVGTGSGMISPNTGDVVTIAALVSAIMACAVVVVISKKNLVEVID